jgi:hypothetical protein
MSYSFSDYTSLEGVVRAMNAARRNGTELARPLTINEESSVPTSRASLNAYRHSHRLEDGAFAILAESRQQRIAEAAEEAERNEPEADYDARQNAVNKVRDMWKDMRGHLKPCERGFVLGARAGDFSDNWSGYETARFVAALQEAAQIYGTTEKHILDLCAAHTFVEELLEGRTEKLTRAEMDDAYHKLSEMLGISFGEAKRIVSELASEDYDIRHGYMTEADLKQRTISESTGDIWCDPDFCREFVELHESKEGYYWIGGNLYFISDQRGINEACGREETAAYIENERRKRLASIMNGTGFSR